MNPGLLTGDGRPSTASCDACDSLQSSVPVGGGKGFITEDEGDVYFTRRELWGSEIRSEIKRVSAF